ncbi:MAG: prepilin-type N-terminal cleavage/methylation domain-containing protein [Rhodocyclaceae bacterium]|nr:prepilin-type N-terminal cleavage/methylation domain-containing protein [Rhodocyclaceae bacterium]
MLSKLMAKSTAELKSLVKSIDVSAVKGRALKRRFEKVRNKQGGFTLLELLVVVAILAAIAGTAAVLLRDTDKKAFAAAHVAMMDQLSKGIVHYAQLNTPVGNYPDNWDSLMASPTGAAGDGVALSILSSDLTDQLTATTLTADEVTAFGEVGITQMRIIKEDLAGADLPADVTSCANAGLQAVVNDKGNAVVSQNIYRSGAANGCGVSVALAADADVFIWNGGAERIGLPSASTDRVVAFGAGPDATLFDPTKYGALTNSPIYRHVDPDQYNRFIVLFNVGATGDTFEKAVFQAIIDGAGDTKDEELGEFDNVRPT